MNKLLIEETNFIILDTETTGMSSFFFDRIIEVGAVLYNKKKGIIKEFSTLINPEKKISRTITDITNIKNDDIKEAPLFKDIAADLSAFIGDNIIVGHNINFDINFLKKEFSICGVEVSNNLTLDTYLFSRALYSGLSSYSLSSIARHINIEIKNAHRALFDVYMTTKIFEDILNRLDNKGIKTIGQLIDFHGGARVFKKTLLDVIRKKIILFFNRKK